MTDQKFCDLYNAYYGHSGVDKMTKPEQLTFHKFNGRTLKEFTDHVEKQWIDGKRRWLMQSDRKGVQRSSFTALANGV